MIDKEKITQEELDILALKAMVADKRAQIDLLNNELHQIYKELQQKLTNKAIINNNKDGERIN